MAARNPEETADTTDHEVRAGPGDAGRQDRPETLPERPGTRRRGRRATTLLVALVAIGLVAWLLFRFAAS